MNENLGSTGTFALFVAVNVVSLMFVRTFVPETKGHSLEDLETRFRPGARLRVSDPYHCSVGLLHGAVR